MELCFYHSDFWWPISLFLFCPLQLKNNVLFVLHLNRCVSGQFSSPRTSLAVLFSQSQNSNASLLDPSIFLIRSYRCISLFQIRGILPPCEFTPRTHYRNCSWTHRRIRLLSFKGSSRFLDVKIPRPKFDVQLCQRVKDRVGTSVFGILPKLVAACFSSIFLIFFYCNYTS